MAKTLRLILGDQLNINHSWFKNVDENCIYVMMELKQESEYVTHHIQKVVGFFSSMRLFAEELRLQNHNLVYTKINDVESPLSLEENILNLIEKHQIKTFEYQLPDEFRVQQQLDKISEKVKTTAFDTEHFLTIRNELETFFEGKKQFVMEYFYRNVRKKYQLLLTLNNEPEGGKWNFDQENRKKWDEKTFPKVQFPISNNVSEIFKEIKTAKLKTIGNIDSENFQWPINRAQSLEILDYFCEHQLPYFGTFQDAMHTNEPFLFHSRLSFALNVKLIHPLEVVNKAIETYRNNQSIDLSQIEGFVRQIIGWREYMRGIYWKFMPEYATKNFFENTAKLPDFFWTGNTKMQCMSKAIQQSIDHAYAHHIQRLMVTGNFTLLAGIAPNEVDAWYLGIYIDAIEWVEITNTRGMSQFADGGIVATKPYISSANYINKMSNYCKGCAYNLKTKTDADSCPFNSLYWHFLDINKSKLGTNNRMAMMYNLLGKISPDEMEKIHERANFIKENINSI